MLNDNQTRRYLPSGDSVFQIISLSRCPPIDLRLPRLLMLLCYLMVFVSFMIASAYSIIFSRPHDHHTYFGFFGI